jgi:hypothetical protein
MYILYNWSDTQEADWFIDNIVPTNRGNQIVDLTLAWLYDYYAFVIPIPDESANINADLVGTWRVHRVRHRHSEFDSKISRSMLIECGLTRI